MPEFYDAIPDDYIAPGESVTVEVDGFPVAVGNVDGTFYAFQNLCPHQGTTLGGRPIKDCVITCSQHSSAYDVTTGKCVAPAEGDGFDQDLMVFEIEVVDGVVRVKV
jgi:3-phenylpropionate/trans-cinnamate dioxygenase ferredoxin component